MCDVRCVTWCSLCAVGDMRVGKHGTEHIKNHLQLEGKDKGKGLLTENKFNTCTPCVT